MVAPTCICGGELIRVPHQLSEETVDGIMALLDNKPEYSNVTSYRFRCPDCGAVSEVHIVSLIIHTSPRPDFTHLRSLS